MIALVISAALGTAADYQPALDKIAIQCGLERGDVTIGEQPNLVRIMPRNSASMSLEKAMCLLPKLSKAGFTYKVGFIAEPRRPGSK